MTSITGWASGPPEDGDELPEVIPAVEELNADQKAATLSSYIVLPALKRLSCKGSRPVIASVISQMADLCVRFGFYWPEDYKDAIVALASDKQLRRLTLGLMENLVLGWSTPSYCRQKYKGSAIHFKH